MDDIKFGLMGCGIVAHYRHLPALQGIAGIRRAALYSPRIASARELAAEFGFETATDDESAFWASNLDLVSITSPSGAHLANLRSAADHGVHVICEKPLAETMEACDEALQLVRSAGIRAMVAFCYRFGAVSRKIRELLSTGAIGSPRTMRLVFNWDCRGKYLDLATHKLNERREGRMREGGPFFDCGVHLIDIARFWTGAEPIRWRGIGSWADDYDAPDHVWGHLDFSNGMHVMAETSISYGHVCANRLMAYRYDIIGTDGVIRYDKTSSTFELQNAQGVQTFAFAEEKDFAEMYRAMFNARSTGDFSGMPMLEDGAIATKIALAITREAMAERPGSPS